MDEEKQKTRIAISKKEILNPSEQKIQPRNKSSSCTSISGKRRKPARNMQRIWDKGYKNTSILDCVL